MKKNIIHILALTFIASIFAKDYVENLGQAATNAAAGAVDVAAAAVGQPVPVRTQDSRSARRSHWFHHEDGNYHHRGLHKRIDEHRYATDKQRLARDKARLTED